MNQSILYLECNSGISGDMTVAALLDLGADRQVLRDALASLPLTGYSIEIKDVYKSGLRACDFNVILEHDNHDHDMEYLHGHSHADHAPHAPHTHTHTHESRNLRDITEIISAGKLSDRARELALRIFRILAEAEASVHGKSVDEVHFHEVGAVDSIVDIVAAAVCLDYLAPSYVVVSPLTDGTGQIRCQHGLIPVPVPAVTAIAAQNNLTLKLTDVEGELVTPTGAAIAAALQSYGALSDDTPQADALQKSDALYSGQALQTSDTPHSEQTLQMSDAPHSGQALQISDAPHSEQASHSAARSGQQSFPAALPDGFRIRKVGLGAGKRDYATTGVLRVMLLEPQSMTDSANVPSPHDSDKGYSNLNDASASVPRGGEDSSDTILSLESNIDDCTGEALSFTMQKLFAHGALDVFYVPIFMKKNRPAYLLRALCRAEDRAVLESIIFNNTTTIGIRVQEMQRTKLPRQVVSLETPWGKADVKCCTYNGETWYYPENDSVSELARKNQIGFPEMYHQIQEYARKALGN